MRDLLIAVKSCEQHRKAGFHEVIRKTWGAKLPAGVDLKFFVGGGPSSDVSMKDDEYDLFIGDGYHSLPFKTLEIARYAWAHRYDHVFLCDTDTFIIPSRLVSCGYEKFDYAGKITKPVGSTFHYDAVDRNGNKEIHEHCYPWASGGYGYFLSRDAAEIISRNYPYSWAEDLWVGQVMGADSDMKICDLPKFYQYVTWHFPQTVYKSGYDLKFNWMEKMQELYGDK
jgi:hypothetical protein